MSPANKAASSPPVPALISTITIEEFSRPAEALPKDWRTSPSDGGLASNEAANSFSKTFILSWRFIISVSAIEESSWFSWEFKIALFSSI